ATFPGRIDVIAGGVKTGSSSAGFFTFRMTARETAPSLFISPEEISVPLGGSHPLKVVDPQGHEVTNVTWSVDTPGVGRIVRGTDESASSPETFVFKAVSAGQAVITATTATGTASAVARVYRQLGDGAPLWALYPDSIN